MIGGGGLWGFAGGVLVRFTEATVIMETNPE